MFGKKLEFPFLRTRFGILMTIALSLLFLATVGLDQASKHHAEGTLLGWAHDTDVKMYRSKSFMIGSIGNEMTYPDEPTYFVRLKFQYQRNVGAAFSMLSDLDSRIRVPFFYFVTVIAVGFIGYYLKTLPLNFHLTRFGLVMILAGAIGNFIDRVHLGYVIDFVDVEWIIYKWRHDFAVFNVADIAINIGIISFILESLLPIKPIMLQSEEVPKARKNLNAKSGASS